MKKYICLFLMLIMIFVTTGVTIFAYDGENTNGEHEETKNTNSVDDEYIADFDSENSIPTARIGMGSGSYTQVDAVFLQTYAAYYFSQLKENLGYNHKGTCSYVAIAMLLSYYDTYWDDSIIEQNIDGVINENWDVVQNGFDITKSLKDNNQSPGVKNEWGEIKAKLIANGQATNQKLSDQIYDNLLLSKSNEYFHLELVRLGTKVLGMKYGIYPDGIFDFLEYYLYTLKGYNSSQVTINYKNWADFEGNKKEYIKSKVKQGIPVIVSGGNISLDPWGHTYIIYDYDEANDELYCHMGWYKNIDLSISQDYSHISFSSIEGTLIGGAISLDFHTEHSHSNNYIGAHNKEYCSCFYANHPAHECSRYYKEYNQIHHTYACDCNPSEENLFDHNFVCDGVENSLHYERCADCGYTVNQFTQYQCSNISTTQHLISCTDCEYSVTSEHDMTISVPLSGTEHGCKCTECDYVDESTLEAHSYNSWVSVNTTTHQSACDGCDARGTTTAPHAFVPVKGSLLNVVCVDCGYTKRKDSDFGNVILSITKVSANGSYILPDGTIMLVDEDIEAYLNGTLVFYDKNNVPQTQ